MAWVKTPFFTRGGPISYPDRQSFLSFLVSSIMHMKYFSCIAVLTFLVSCQPKVQSFSAEPTRIGAGDSVRLIWKTRGTASMSYRQTKVYLPPDSVETLEFILTARRWNKVSAPSVRQVVVGQQRDMLALGLDSLQGDSLVFSAEKDTAFHGYIVGSLLPRSADPITVRHSGQICLLRVNAPGDCMQGLPYSGRWVVKRKATAAELADRHQRPGNYFILSTINPK